MIFRSMSDTDTRVHDRDTTTRWGQKKTMTWMQQHLIDNRHNEEHEMMVGLVFSDMQGAQTTCVWAQVCFLFFFAFVLLIYLYIETMHNNNDPSPHPCSKHELVGHFFLQYTNMGSTLAPNTSLVGVFLIYKHRPTLTTSASWYFFFFLLYLY